MSVPNVTTTGEQGSYTFYERGTANDPTTWIPVPMTQPHGPCPTCGKCQCCDEKPSKWRWTWVDGTNGHYGTWTNAETPKGGF